MAASNSDKESVASIEPINISNITPANPLKTPQDFLEDTSLSARLFRYAQEQRKRDKDPWFQEYAILHRMNIADLNNKLAVCKNDIYLNRGASDEQMARLRELLNDQATAIRNFQYIQSQDWLDKADKEEHTREMNAYFPEFAKTERWNEYNDPYHSENYRILPKVSEPYKHGDPLRNLLCYLPVRFTYSKEERKDRKAEFENNVVPRDVSPHVEKLARFIIALFGAVSILVPTIIMSFHRSRTEALITTSVSVILFAMCCSFTLNTANDQTLAATAGYAAVLMVFVGLTI